MFQVDSGNIPVILVGGGSILVDCSRPLHGSSALIRPLHFDVSAFSVTTSVCCHEMSHKCVHRAPPTGNRWFYDYQLILIKGYNTSTNNSTD